MNPSKTCSIEGCGKPHMARGWCANHYKRWELYGDPLGRGTKHAPRGTGCINAEGYRVFTVKGRQVKEHRMVMERVLGRPLEDWEVVHHRDGDKLNNDPSNLAITSHSQHGTHHAAERTVRTHCGHGHPWTEENTYWRRNGFRMCRTCHREYQRERHRRKVAASRVPLC